MVQYNVYDLRNDPDSFEDADYITHVVHDPDDGALVLTHKVVDALRDCRFRDDEEILDSRTTDGSS